MRLDEKNFLDNSFAPQFLSIFGPKGNQGATFDDIIKAIDDHRLQIEQASDSISVIDDKSLGKIKDCIPFLLRIVERPRSNITTLEEKRPVETATHINRKAIAKLSRDSNDWYACQILSVVPKNISADIPVENLAIYENRFLVTLIERINEIVDRKKADHDKKKNDIGYGELSAPTSQSEGFVSGKGSQYYDCLNRIKTYDRSFFDVLGDKLDQEGKDIEEVFHRTRILLHSQFYRLLNRTRRVKNPIQKTNLLIFDQNYNKAYRLWMDLEDAENKVKMVVRDDATSDSDSQFFVYCICNLFFTFHALAYKSSASEKVIWDDKDKPCRFTGAFKVVKGSDCFEIRPKPDKNRIICTFTDGKREDSFIIRTDFKDFEKDSFSFIENYLAERQDESAKETEERKYDSVYSLYCFDIPTFGKANGLTDRCYHRFLNIGDNYSKLEPPDKIKRWANYKTGALIISPQALTFNILGLARMINLHRMLHLDMHEIGQKCPICNGERHFKRNSDGGADYICNDCHHHISIQHCAQCDHQRKRPFLWVRQTDAKERLGNQKFTSKISTGTLYEQMQQYDFFNGPFGITSFIVEKEPDRITLKTICPRCGHVLGNETTEKLSNNIRGRKQ